MLAHNNPHERDTHISFDEGPHIYTIDGDSDYTSVTTFNHRHFEAFDADKIITKMMSGKNWSNSKYYGQTREQIKEGGRQIAMRLPVPELRCTTISSVIITILHMKMIPLNTRISKIL